jgi:hypothetical protein
MSYAWQSYPEYLPPLGGCKYGYDLPKYNSELKNDSGRLFVGSDNRISIKIIELIDGGKPRSMKVS